MVNIKPNRTNWKQFCQEPPLTEDEIAEWNELASAIMQNDALFDAIAAETEAEWQRAYSLKPGTKDWTDMVEWADANRALQRAEIKAHRKWRKNDDQ